MYFKGDFHIHSNKSDGEFSPSELVKLAKSENIDIMSLTDHDTTDGLNESIFEGKKINVEVIPGIELSTRYNGESIHVLGYFKDNSYKNEKFQNFLKEITDFRAVRAKLIVTQLEKHFNIIIDYNKILENAKGVVARPHIARAIIDTGYKYSLDYIFNNILNEGSPAYVPNKKLELENGINLLKSVNAIVILAHPILVKNSSIEHLMSFDFDGLEAIYPQNSANDTKRFTKIAAEYNKIITAGSDFHTGKADDTKHGKLGSVFLDESKINIFFKKLVE